MLLLRSVNGACIGGEMTLDIPVDNLDDADLGTLSSESRCADLIGMDSCIADCVATAAVSPCSGSQSFLGTAVTYSPRTRKRLLCPFSADYIISFCVRQETTVPLAYVCETTGSFLVQDCTTKQVGWRGSQWGKYGPYRAVLAFIYRAR
jgi:hypothetical protein